MHLQRYGHTCHSETEACANEVLGLQRPRVPSHGSSHQPDLGQAGSQRLQNLTAISLTYLLSFVGESA